MDWVRWILAPVPGADEALRTLSTGAPLDWVKTIGAMLLGAIIAFITSAETIKLIWKTAFRKKSEMTEQLKSQAGHIAELIGQIDGLRADKQRLERRVADELAKHPGAAIARAEKELRDRNESSAIYHLEEWFNGNASSIGAIALRLARYHIAQAVPEPGDHLKRADQLLLLARGATPGDQEARELFNQFSQVNASLQEQMIRAGDDPIVWNAATGKGRNARGEGMLPLITTFRKVADYCHDKGFPRLAPLFGDRAADLARQGSAPLRKVWFQVEPRAIFYQIVAGHHEAALDRIDFVLTEARIHLTVRDRETLDAQYMRARVLQDLGRPADALAEIDAFAPIMAEVKGARHPDTLSTRYLRASVLRDLGRPADALAEIDAFAPIMAEVNGARHPSTLSTRSLRAVVLQDLGRPADALAEIDAFAPIEAEVKGARHPDTLTTRYLRASVLQDLGRPADALAEIDAFAPIKAEVKGARHPHTLATRSLRIGIEIAEHRNVDHMAALTDMIAGLTKALGPSARQTLFARYRLARLWVGQRRMAEAAEELRAVIASFDPQTDPASRLLRSAHALLVQAEGGPPAGGLVT